MNLTTLKNAAEAALAWLHGWRRDMDGWLVRARRATDPDDLALEHGFVEDSCVVVRSPHIALLLDRAARSTGAKP